MPAIQVTIENTRLDPDLWFQLCDDFLELLRDETPIDTGFCRDQWEITDQSETECTFYNGAEYASYLDEGWSNQAPDGMTRPALRQLPSLVAGYD